MKQFNFILILCFVCVVIFADVPENYYQSAEGKSGSALRTSLAGVIGGHIVVSYDNLKELYKYSDTENAIGKYLIDIYSTCQFTAGSAFCSGEGCGGYNREHSVPKSWFSEGKPMYSDAFHLYPTSCYVNSYRGNYALGECSGGTKCTTNGMTEALGRRGSSTFSGYSGVVFEPDDEYKGDLARSYFYMATRYADQCSNWGGGMFGSDNNGFKTWAVNLLLKWHRQDPVSEKEKIRNEAIYGNPVYNKGTYKQGNRNPFIDYPCLAEYVWGNKSSESVNFSTILSSYSNGYATTTDKSGCSCIVATNPTIVSPINNSTIFVGTTNVDEQVSTTFTIKGILLTKPINLSVNGTYFSLSTTTITAAEALAGKIVTIYYNPSASGNHIGTLMLSSVECSSVSVSLSGTCGILALNATNVHGSGFCANWMDSGASSYSLDVYTKDNGVSPFDTLYEESFSDGEGDFSIKNVLLSTGLSYIWKWDSQYGMKASAFLNKEAYASESWLISPEINLTTSISASFSFKHTTYQATQNSEYLKLMISEDGKNTWRELTIPNWPSVRWTFVSSGTIDLTSYVGKNVYLAFKYQSTSTSGISCDTWEIKNFLLEETHAVIENTSVTGYPKPVGNVLTYCMDGLGGNATYYYKVTPSGEVPSNEIAVNINTTKNIDVEKNKEIECFVYQGRALIRQLPLGSDISLYDCTGTLLTTVSNCSETEIIQLPMRGVYLLRINTGSKINTYKLMN